MKVITSITLDKDKHDRLKEESKRLDRSISWIISMIIDSFFEHQELKKETKNVKA